MLVSHLKVGFRDEFRIEDIFHIRPKGWIELFRCKLFEVHRLEERMLHDFLVLIGAAT